MATAEERRETDSGIEVKPVYTEEDVAGLGLEVSGEVGRTGVAIDSLADMEILFDAIPLGEVSTSMTINAPAALLLLLYELVAERQGVPGGELRGTVQNDILKEYVARGNYIFPPRASMRITTDLFAYCHAAVAAGLSPDEFGARLSFFFNAHNHFFQEVAKFRAARRLWAQIMRDRFGATNPKAQALPSERSARIALRTQQILASEAGATDTADPLGGSFFLEALTRELEVRAWELIGRIDELGGAVAAVEQGFTQHEG